MIGGSMVRHRQSKRAVIVLKPVPTKICLKRYRSVSLGQTSTSKRSLTKVEEDRESVEGKLSERQGG